MDLKLKGKNALVFAASKGIGKSIAKLLYTEGANVAFCSRNIDDLKKAHDEIAPLGSGVLFYDTCDLAKSEDIATFIKATQKKLGKIDILINNQGGPTPGNFSAISEVQLQEALNNNLLSIFRASKLCLPDMIDKKWGRIINILSISAKEPIPTLLLSNMTRSSVLAMAKTMAKEYAQYGITINSLLPNAVLTDRTLFFMKQKSEEQKISIEEAIKQSATSLPIGHIASPEEFNQLTLFLCSEAASYVNGTAISVDGGASAGLF